MIITGNWAELLDPGLRKIYGDEYNQYPEEYSRFLTVETSGKAYEDTLSMGLFGLVPQKNQGRSVDYQDPIQGLTHRLTHVTYGMGFIISSEMAEDDLYGKMRALPKGLARSVRHTVETIGANILNRAQTAAYTGADGKVLAATDHPLLRGGTFQNRPTVNADLSMTSYEQSLIDIAAFTDEAGLIMAAKAKMLVVAPSNEWTAEQLLGSDKDPESNFNAINPGKGKVPYMVGHFLTDPDAWGMVTDVPNGLIFYWRRRPAFTKDNDFDSENGKWKTTFRCVAGWDDPRGIYWSAGA